MCIKLLLTLRDRYRLLFRSVLRRKNTAKLRNFNPTILSSNCVGAVICHDLGLRFNSPTVNMYMTPHDFVKFLERIDYYLGVEVVETKDADRGYPVGALDDILLYFVHYDNFDNAKKKWTERAARVDLSNTYVMMVERDGCTIEDLKRFDGLPYANKVAFVAKPMAEIDAAICLPGTTEGGQVTDLCSYQSPLSWRRHIDKFDYVEFINRGCK